jgi:hypothetical protein
MQGGTMLTEARTETVEILLPFGDPRLAEAIGQYGALAPLGRRLAGRFDGGKIGHGLGSNVGIMGAGSLLWFWLPVAAARP